MKYLGIDYGGKRIGLAIGDDETHIAVPFETVEADSLKEAVAAITLLIKEENIEKIVLGLPISMSGKEGGQVEIVRKFGAVLEKESGIKVEYEDERRSSKAAEGLTKGLHMENKDAVAAMVILQTYLDRMKNFKRV